MDTFLKRVTPPQEEHQASPSGCIPHEGIVVIGDDSSMQVLPMKTLQWDKMWRWKTVILMILTLCRPELMSVCACVLVFYKKV